MKVLIIDDKMDNAIGVKSLLRGTAEVAIENSLHGAVESVKDFKPDAILCDAGLGDSAPMDTAKMAPSMFPGIPVIIWSCHFDENLAATAIENGAVDFMVKTAPGTTETIKQRIVIAHLRNLYAATSR